MLNLELDVLELAVRAAAVYCVLLLMMRMTGKRTIGQFTPFDLLVVMLISEAAGPAMTGKDESLLGGLLVCIFLIGLNSLVGLVSSRSLRVEHLLEGEPVLVGRDGKFFESTYKKHRLSHNDMQQALREADCDLEELGYAFLEVDGTISIQKKKHT